MNATTKDKELLVPASASDAELIEFARSGDHRAFSTLLQRHDKPQRGLAHRMVGDASQMDDVLQEAYLKAWRNLSGFRGDSSFSTWLYRITYRVCIDALRARKPLDQLDIYAVASAPGSDPTSAVDRVDLLAALGQLSEISRAVVVLVDAEGRSYDEVATILDIAPGTVASRLNRARAALRIALSDPEGDLR